MEDNREYAEPVDISTEVTITDPRPRFTGTYSDVYIGQFRNQIVAVKIIKLVSRKSLKAMQRKMSRERELWAALEHTNIVPFYGYAGDERMFGLFGALISPWYAYGDAGQFLDAYGEQMDMSTRSKLWMGVIAGVHYIHTYTPVIVHGDLKPGNILIDDQLNARLCDFGIARVLAEAGTSGFKTTSEHTGTERYLSYELVLSDETCAVTTDSDVYALACIGLDFIFLQPPHASRKNNLRGHIFQDIREKLPPARRPSALLESLRPLWDIFEFCWHVEPERRPSAAIVMVLHQQWHEAAGHDAIAVEQTSRDKVISSSSVAQDFTSQPQSFAINAHTAQKFTLPMYKFHPPDKDPNETSATQDGGNTSGFGGWPFTPQRLQIDTGRPGHPTSNASGDSASREPTSATFSIQSGSTRSNKLDPFGLFSGTSFTDRTNVLYSRLINTSADGPTPLPVGIRHRGVTGVKRQKEMDLRQAQRLEKALEEDEWD